MLVRWNNGAQSWIPLKDVKEHNPLETEEYAMAQVINSEPDFS